MTSRFARLCLVSAILPLIGVRAQTPGGPLPEAPRPTPPAGANPAPVVAAPSNFAPTNKPNTDDDLVSLKLPDVDIDTVLSTLKLYSGKTILRPAQLPTAPGGYNLQIDKPIPRSQAILYIETILAMNQIAVIPMGNDALKIVPLTSARIEAPELIAGSTLDMPPSSKVASKLFLLDFLRVQEFQQMLTMIGNPNISQPVPVQNANAILVTDTISNLQRIEVMLQQIDKPLMSGMTPKFYPLHHAKASDLVGKLHGMLVGPLQAQIGQITNYSADDRTNQIILITDPRQYPFFDELIEKLDIVSDPNTRNEVIYLKHAKASDVVSTLNPIIKGQTQTTPSRPANPRGNSNLINATLPGQAPAPAAPPTPTVVSASSAGNPALDQGSANEFSSLLTIANDDRSNSIIVSGTQDDIRLMHELIDKLDIVLAQVRIEVVIAEVTLDDNHQSGIDKLGLQLDGDRLIGFSGSAAGLSLGGAADGTGFAKTSRIGGPGSLARSIDLVGIINLGTTPRKDNTVILSVPTITTSHAKQATIFVGETRPIVSGSVNSGLNGGTTSTTQQQKIGINLDVTPLIGADGSVYLDIKQDVDEVGPNVIIDGNPIPIVFTRTTSSSVSVADNQIVVLGGLQRKTTTKTTSRLGPIPIIGDLFGSRQNEEKRTELIFFLRPHVLTNSPTDNVSTMKRVDDLPQKDEIRKTLDPAYQPAKKSVIDRIMPK